MTAKTDPLRANLIRLAHSNPSLRPTLLPLLRESRGKTALDFQRKTSDDLEGSAFRVLDAAETLQETLDSLNEFSKVGRAIAGHVRELKEIHQKLRDLSETVRLGRFEGDLV